MGAIRPPGKTADAAVVDNQMGIHRPVFFWNKRSKIEFDLNRILVKGKAEQAVDPYHVRIHRDTRNPKSVPQDHIGGFASDPRDRHKIFHARRHFPIEFFQDRFGGAQDVFCFIPVKTGAVDDLLDIAYFRSRKGPNAGISLEKSGGDLIDQLVRALRRKDRSDKKLPGRFKMKRATDIWVRIGQPFVNGLDSFLFSLKRFLHNAGL